MLGWEVLLLALALTGLLVMTVFLFVGGVIGIIYGDRYGKYCLTIGIVIILIIIICYWNNIGIWLFSEYKKK